MNQGTPEWFQKRLGKITASRIADILATTKTGHAATRANYCAQLVAERMTGLVQESYNNAAMQWGTETEPLARVTYEIRIGEMIDQIDFVDHSHVMRSGASPDGLIGSKGLIEIKCPNTATHIGYLLDGIVPKKYVPQMAWQLACTGRKWCDFVSFDPRMAIEDQFFCVRYTPDEKYLAELEAEVIKFDLEVEELIKQIISKRRQHER